MGADAPATRRIEITLRKPWFALYGFIRPTLVVSGRAQPVQWGLGTWQVPADRPEPVGVFLYNRVWRFGQAALVLQPEQAAIEYRAPVLPFLRGRIRTTS